MPRAEADLDAIYLYIRASTAPLAERWFVGLIEAIESLANTPHRTAKTPEDKSLHQLIYGKKPHFYRIIYAIDESRKRVEVLHVRHHGRQAFQADDLD
jgi:plasmid stabilization system protein ParE